MEKLFGLENVLVNIYTKLIFADQLRLAQVNSSFERIFADFIVPIKYRKLKIRKLKVIEEFLLSNEKNDDCICVNQDEIANLLKFGARYVDEFQAFGAAPEKISYAVVCGNLPNLTCLYYQHLYLSEKHLLLIAENCPQLRELRLISCQNNDKEYCLMIQKTVSVSTLEKMRQLKSLEIYNSWTPPIDMSLFCELIMKVPLECLKLNALLQPDADGNFKERTIHHNLQELEIKVDCESLIKYLGRLGVFKTLSKLHLELWYDVTDSTLQLLSEACENLECLSFLGDGGEVGATFEDITHFQIPPNLKELSLRHCRGLNGAHIKDALTKFRIEQFRYEQDSYERWRFFNFKISHHIRVLDMVGVNTPQFSSFYSNNKLKELHWYDYPMENYTVSDDTDSDDTELSLSDSDDTQSGVCLKTCRNLETLVIHSGFVPLKDILELKHLKKLQIFKRLSNFDLSSIISLLKHPPLRELTFRFVIPEQFHSPVPSFPSSVTKVKIVFKVLQMHLDFWLNMLQQNPKMSITCYIGWIKCQNLFNFLKILLHHENFPKDIREINIEGFNLDCHDLRKNLMPTMELLKKVCNYVRGEHWASVTLILRR